MSLIAREAERLIRYKQFRKLYVRGEEFEKKLKQFACELWDYDEEEKLII